jgi:hypothetical protein
MTSIDSNIKIPSPFLQGIASCFDIAGFFDDIRHPAPEFRNPIEQDWQTVSLDYNNSMNIINEEFHAAKRNAQK